MKRPYYVVLMGREPGIYRTWEEVLKQTRGFMGACFAKKETLQEAQELFRSDKKYSSAAEVAQTKRLSTGLNLLNIYVDGSYKPTTDVYSYSFAVIKDGSVIYKKSGANRDSKVTSVLSGSNAGELKATLEALLYAFKNGHKNVLIYYDFSGIKKLATGEQQPDNDYTKKYVELIKKFEKCMKIEFTKVKAHDMNYYNNLVDNLAKEARVEFETKLTKDSNDITKNKVKKTTIKKNCNDTESSFSWKLSKEKTEIIENLILFYFFKFRKEYKKALIRKKQDELAVLVEQVARNKGLRVHLAHIKKYIRRNKEMLEGIYLQKNKTL